MSEHICTECFSFASQHEEACEVDGCEGHWPPLCCRGCDCRSFEDAHLDPPAEQDIVIARGDVAAAAEDVVDRRRATLLELAEDADPPEQVK